MSQGPATPRCLLQELRCWALWTAMQARAYAEDLQAFDQVLGDVARTCDVVVMRVDDLVASEKAPDA